MRRAQAFSADDDVVLIVHSAYGDDFMLEQIARIQASPASPELLFFQVAG
jgi:hypothetical protein